MRLLAIDTETEAFPPRAKIRTDWRVPRFVCASWCAEDSEGVTTNPTDLDIRHDDVLVFHNAAFDLAVLAAAGLDLKPLVLSGRVLDTMVLYHHRYVLRDRPRTLDAIHEHLFGQSLDKSEVRLSFQPGVPLTQTQHDYALQDARATLRVSRRLLAISHGGLAPFYPCKFVTAKFDDLDPDVLYSTASALRAWHLEPKGLSVDKEVWARLHREYDASLSSVRRELIEAGLVRAERDRGAPISPGYPTADPEMATIPRKWHHWKGDLMRRCVGKKGARRLQTCRARWILSTKELRTRFERTGIQAPVSKKKELISLDHKFWRPYREFLPADLRAYLTFAKCSKVLSAFLSPLDGVERVCPSYWIPGAETGRWSCSGPNLQQVPKALRPLFVAEEGWVFVSADYKSLELYTLSHAMTRLGITGPLSEALRSGQDIHELTAQQMGASFTRQDAKTANFGLPGGMAPHTFLLNARSMGADWDLKRAREVRDAWFRLYTDVAQYLSLFEINVYAELKPEDIPADEWLEELDFDPEQTWPRGRQIIERVNGGKVFRITLPSGRVLPHRRYTSAANGFFQGLGADVITQAFVNCCRRDLNVRAVVHDSITISCPVRDGEAKGVELSRCMGDALNTVCPSVESMPIFEISRTL